MRFEDHPLHKALGLSLVEQRRGYAKIVLHTSDVTIGGVGDSVHGGVLAAMVDVVMLQAIVSTIDPGKEPAGTADLNLTYLRPALGDRVYAEAEVVKNGRQLAMVEVAITDDQDRLCAKGRTLYAFRPASG